MTRDCFSESSVSDSDVTIVLPFKNAARYLPETLRSVAEQTYPHWRLLAINDGSSDESAEIVESFRKAFPHKTEVLVTEGVGAAKARNLAVAKATTRYVAFLDADDCWTAEKLACQIPAMRSSGACFSYTAYSKIDGDSRRGGTTFIAPEGITYERLLAGNPIRCFTVVYDQRKLGPVTMPDIKMRNDLLGWLLVLDKLRRRESPASEILPGATEPAGENCILALNQHLGYYRQYGDSLTGNKLKAAKYQWIAYRHYLRLSLLRSCTYFSQYAFNGVRTYLAK